MDRSTHPIAVTKLQPPTIGQKVLRRVRLEQLLDQVFTHRITLVCAGAGYGKTTALAALPLRHQPLVWYSLSRRDADPSLFLSYLSEGIASVLPDGSCSIWRNHIRQIRAKQDTEAFVAHLTNSLAGCGDSDLPIVLDDYHLVEHSRAVNQLLDLFISQMPPHVHLVISSRTNISLPLLPRLRAAGEVVDVDHEKLRFTRQEAAEMIIKSNDVELSSDILDTLMEKTEGWPIGLQFAGQILSNRPSLDEAELVLQFTNSQKPLFEYLAHEVFLQQPPEVQQFLLHSSVLSSLDARTCDVVMHRRDSRRILDHLRQRNLLISTLDNSAHRYHRLFRDFLRDRLSQDSKTFARIHDAAAHHYHMVGNNELAIQHFLAAGTYTSAASLISSVAEAMLRESRFDTLVFWIDQLPAKLVEEFPDIIVKRAEIDEIRGHYDSSLHWYDWAAKLYRDRGDLLGLSRVLRSKGYILNWRVCETEDASRLHTEALSYLPEDHKAERAAVLIDLARDKLSAGDTALSFNYYNQAVQIYEDLEDKEGQLAALINPGAWLHFDRGDFARSVALLQRAAALARELNCRHQLAEINNALAAHLFLWGRVNEARSYALQALELSRKLGCDFSEAFALMNLANATYESDRDTIDQALTWYDRALQIFEMMGNHRFIVVTLTFTSAALRRGGDTTRAIHLARRALTYANSSSACWMIALAKLSLAAALLKDSPWEARSLLYEAIDTFQSYDAKYNLAFAFFCLGVLAKQTDDEEWQGHVSKCLKLSRDGGYDCLFQRESVHSVPLLLDALEAKIEPEYVAELLPTLRHLAVDRLIHLLSHEDLTVRQRAIRILGKIGDVRAWKALLKCANSPIKMIKQEAKIALAHFAPPEQPLLEIRCLGPFAVKRGQVLIAEDEWKRKKVKSVLKYLVSAPEFSTTREEIIDIFWPDLDEQAALNNLYRTLHHLRRILDPSGKFPQHGPILFEDGIISLTNDAISTIDIEDFQQYVADARTAEHSGDIDTARVCWEAAIEIYRGDFLADDPYEDWPQRKREEFRETYFAALSKLSNYWAARQDWDIAAAYLRKILTTDPTLEEIHLQLMSLLVRAGNRFEALQQYRRCERILREELETDPMPETKAYFRKLLSEVT